jgi:hypothetical protein
MQQLKTHDLVTFPCPRKAIPASKLHVRAVYGASWHKECFIAAAATAKSHVVHSDCFSGGRRQSSSIGSAGSNRCSTQVAAAAPGSAAPQPSDSQPAGGNADAPDSDLKKAENTGAAEQPTAEASTGGGVGDDGSGKGDGSGGGGGGRGDGSSGESGSTPSRFPMWLQVGLGCGGLGERPP